MNGDGWQEYLVAAQRLDAVRRAAATGTATATAGNAATAHAAREELARVQTQLAVQHRRLRELGVPEVELRPTAAELAVVATPMRTGPESVLVALRQARNTTETANGRLVQGGWWTRISLGPGSRPGLLLLVPIVLTALMTLACLGIATLALLR